MGLSGRLVPDWPLTQPWGCAHTLEPQPPHRELGDSAGDMEPRWGQSSRSKRGGPAAPAAPARVARGGRPPLALGSDALSAGPAPSSCVGDVTPPPALRPGPRPGIPRPSTCPRGAFRQLWGPVHSPPSRGCCAFKGTPVNLGTRLLPGACARRSRPGKPSVNYHFAVRLPWAPRQRVL